MHNGDDLAYSFRAKKAVLFKPDNGFLGLNLKGRLLTDKELKPVIFSSKNTLAVSPVCVILLTTPQCCSQSQACAPWSLQTKTTGSVELAWTILDLKQGQDVRLKVGYELCDKVIRPFLFPADAKCSTGKQAT